jgi:hypothetical protein
LSPIALLNVYTPSMFSFLFKLSIHRKYLILLISLFPFTFKSAHANYNASAVPTYKITSQLIE